MDCWSDKNVLNLRDFVNSGGTMAYGSIEGQKRLQDYVNRFIDALTSQNGTQLSALLAITSSPFRDAVGSALDLVKVTWF